jgi:NADH-quinone oxidoreductase subunit G
MGLISRGEDVEITTYLETAMASELQGNVVDLCPVGALTSKPYEFTARPWELSKTESVDVNDAVGTNIRVDVRGREVLRILPRLNEAVNEEWISDKTRHVVDGLRTQRLDRPYVREGGRLKVASWSAAFDAIKSRLFGVPKEKIGILAGGLASVEELYSLKALAEKLGIANLDARPAGSRLDPAKGKASYRFNTTIAGLEEADAVLIVGSNPRKEAPILNARIRKRWRSGQLKVALIGEKVDLTYAYDYLGTGPETLTALANGQISFLETLKAAKKPVIIVGEGAVTREDGAAVLAAAAKLAVDVGAATAEWNGFNVLATEASRVGALDLGFVPGQGGLDTAGMLAGGLEVVLVAGADEADLSTLGNAFVIYLGSHGDKGAHRADVILPGAAYTEKSGTYVNTEGRVQVANRAAFPPGEAREDWAIIRALSEVLGVKLPWDSLAQLRAKLYSAYPHLAAVDSVSSGSVADVATLAEAGGAMNVWAFVSPVKDFYLTNPIARASRTMAECSALASGRAAQAAE